MLSKGVVVAIILAVVGACFVIIIIHRCFFGPRGFGTRWVGGWIHNPRAFEAKKRRSMKKENDLRRDQEEDTTKGTPVWFSRWVKNGNLRHWVVYTHHTKYELRLPSDMTTLEKIAKTVLSTSQYICTPAAWDKEKEMMEMRQEYIEQDGRPYAEGYYICLIGWTSHSKAEVDDRFATVARQLGNYSVYHNCQTLLKLFAKEILNSHRAADHGWFAQNVKTEFQKLLDLPPTEEIVARQFQMLEAAMQGDYSQQMTLQQQNHVHAAHHRFIEGVVQQAVQRHAHHAGGHGGAPAPWMYTPGMPMGPPAATQPIMMGR
ncbi:hypothetical protein H2204_002823 [Knufia peltigerae]|uniref:Uncharacterized protein n=1 Tax=Knufia peltigerae TaxID=1002370 RepID=A0AA39D0A3_9EURO|nr:hypothetical protein H2204_002823 [Knufia peltigerae]